MDSNAIKTCNECGIACPCANKRYKHLTLDQAKSTEISAEKKSFLIFVVSGQVEIVSSHTNNHSNNYMVPSGHIALLSQSHNYTLKAIENADILCITMSDKIGICQYVSAKELNDAIQKVEINNSTLPIVDRMRDFVRSAIHYIDDNINCEYLYNAKDGELFAIFRHYYPLEQITQLFYPILEGKFLFQSLVISNYRKAKNVEQLATICGYGLSNFKRLFKQYFDQTPYQWILERISNDVRQALLDKSIPLKVIAGQFNFADQSHLNAYCKKYLGATPGQIREG